MPLFAIIAFDAANSKAKRVEELKRHVDALASLKKAGQLFSAGPLTASVEDEEDEVGSLLVVNFENHLAAKKWFDQEPYFKAGVYDKVIIQHYIDAMDYISSFDANHLEK